MEEKFADDLCGIDEGEQEDAVSAISEATTTYSAALETKQRDQDEREKEARRARAGTISGIVSMCDILM